MSGVVESMMDNTFLFFFFLKEHKSRHPRNEDEPGFQYQEV